jgi:hypothetical protein
MDKELPVPSKKLWSVASNRDVINVSWGGDLDDVYDERHCSFLYRLPLDKRRRRTWLAFRY